MGRVNLALAFACYTKFAAFSSAKGKGQFKAMPKGGEGGRLRYVLMLVVGSY